MPVYRNRPIYTNRQARQSAACLYRHASFFVLAKWRTVLSPGTGGQPPDPTGSNCDANAEAGRINSRQNQQSASAMAENTGESGWKKTRARADVCARSSDECIPVSTSDGTLGGEGRGGESSDCKGVAISRSVYCTEPHQLTAAAYRVSSTRRRRRMTSRCVGRPVVFIDLRSIGPRPQRRIRGAALKHPATCQLEFLRNLRLNIQFTAAEAVVAR